MLKIDPSHQAAKFLKKLQPKQSRQIGEKILALRMNPNPPDSEHLKGEKSNYLRTDIGEFRIIYRVEGDVLKVVVIGKRNDNEVYRIICRK